VCHVILFDGLMDMITISVYTFLSWPQTQVCSRRFFFSMFFFLFWVELIIYFPSVPLINKGWRIRSHVLYWCLSCIYLECST
jgi:hypothetical protein